MVKQMTLPMKSSKDRIALQSRPLRIVKKWMTSCNAAFVVLHSNPPAWEITTHRRKPPVLREYCSVFPKKKVVRSSLKCRRQEKKSDVASNRCSAGKYAELEGTLSCTSMKRGTTEICKTNVEADYAFDCKICEIGTFSDRLGSTSNKCCRAGQAVSVDTCKPCQVGFYQNITGQSTCIKCNLANSTSDPGSIAPNDCYVSCPQGKRFFGRFLLQSISGLHPSELNTTKMAQVIMHTVDHCARCVLKI